MMKTMQRVKGLSLIYLRFFILVLSFSFGILDQANALTYDLPKDGDIVGEIRTVRARGGESLGDIGQEHDLGVYEMIEANPNLDPWYLPSGATVILPTQFILPPGPRKGIILNLAEMRLYYFPANKQTVTTYPVGIGKKGWTTPLINTTIIGKKVDPDWTPPLSIRKEHALKGDILPAVVKAGPDNPLGRHAFYLGIKGFLFHGTNRPTGVGLRTSHGCIRLFPKDIEALYEEVPVGTSFRVIHEPFKVGWSHGHLYLEAHQPLTEPQYVNSNSLSRLNKIISDAIVGSYILNWNSATQAARASLGYPVRID